MSHEKDLLWDELSLHSLIGQIDLNPAQGVRDVLLSSLSKPSILQPTVPIADKKLEKVFNKSNHKHNHNPNPNPNHNHNHNHNPNPNPNP